MVVEALYQYKYNTENLKSTQSSLSTLQQLTSRLWSLCDRVSLIDSDISSSCVSFCRPKATAPLVTMIHSRPSWWHSATCSTIEARRPNARPLPSSLVITALPSFTTSLLAYFSWDLSVKVCCFLSALARWRFSMFMFCKKGGKKINTYCFFTQINWKRDYIYGLYYRTHAVYYKVSMNLNSTNHCTAQVPKFCST